ncbi:MAG: CDP-diacylglycerol--glycerol-3-phosphate 3-phosphatidyltransferase [Actinomycetota bacterium]
MDRGRVVLGAVTWLRVLLVPVIIALVLAGPTTDGAFVAATVLFTIAALTDLLDGYLARRWNFGTPLGSFLDTTADKLLVSGTLLALVEVGRTSAWIAFVIIGRELLVLGLKGIVAGGGGSVAATMLGKVKATVQFFAIGMATVTLGPDIGPLPLHAWAMLLATAITLGSAVDYLGRYRAALADRA